MRDEKVGSLTQDGLVAELHRRGYDDVTERQIADWRRKDLLQPFDVIGAGRGRRRGRERSSWSNGESGLNQALWVRELLQIFGNVEDTRLPLWVLGYPVPLERGREALGGPLNEITESIVGAIENEARVSGEIEDIIEETAYQHVEEMRRAGAEALMMPQHSLEAFIKVFINQGYDLTDGSFELGAEELQEYESAMRQRHAAVLAAKGLGNDNLARQDSSLMSFIDRAPFIKQYFSLHQLKLALDECTDGDLRAIQRVQVWNRMLHFYRFNHAEFEAHYHKRSNVETTFHMIKSKFGERLRGKTETAQINEAFAKVLCHNICCVIQSIHELGIEPTFHAEFEPVRKGLCCKKYFET